VMRDGYRPFEAAASGHAANACASTGGHRFSARPAWLPCRRRDPAVRQ
jgi:hypothetical protein